MTSQVTTDQSGDSAPLVDCWLQTGHCCQWWDADFSLNAEWLVWSSTQNTLVMIMTTEQEWEGGISWRRWRKDDMKYETNFKKTKIQIQRMDCVMHRQLKLNRLNRLLSSSSTPILFHIEPCLYGVHGQLSLLTPGSSRNYQWNSMHYLHLLMWGHMTISASSTRDPSKAPNLSFILTPWL